MYGMISVKSVFTAAMRMAHASICMRPKGNIVHLGTSIVRAICFMNAVNMMMIGYTFSIVRKKG